MGFLTRLLLCETRTARWTVVGICWGMRCTRTPTSDYRRHGGVVQIAQSDFLDREFRQFFHGKSRLI